MLADPLVKYLTATRSSPLPLLEGKDKVLGNYHALDNMCDVLLIIFHLNQYFLCFNLIFETNRNMTVFRKESPPTFTFDSIISEIACLPLPYMH